ncbi:MAG TPA: MBL fold metallo-hydrolase [Candidatus Acidoferrum sp.]|nr:MBL fold metallo-hydrolase [Candidatus Acidoferrum sp.]
MTGIHVNRRTLLFSAVGLAAYGVTGRLWAADAALDSYKVNDRIQVITGAGGNVVVYKGDGGVTLIDTGAPDRSADVLKMVDTLTGKAPIRTVFNSHWHDDHTGGNEAMHARGARIIAHINTKLWLGADFDVYWRNTTHKPRPKAALPDETFYTGGKLDLGGETLEYAHLPQAHTDGDIYLYFRQSNVMALGAFMTNKQYPIADIATGGWLGGLVAANKAILAMIDDNTVLIPSRGPALKKSDLKAQYDMLSDVYDTMKKMMQDGYSGNDMLKEKITAKYDAVWGMPDTFILETYRGMAAHTYDMGGFI